MSLWQTDSLASERGAEVTIFPFGQIVLCALAGGAASVVLLVLYRAAGIAPRSAIAFGLVVALSILVWRTAANTASLNDDPVPFFSPNDVLCPVITYTSLGLYVAARPTAGGGSWPLVRLLLTAVSLAANVALI